MANFDSSEAVFRSDAPQLSKIMDLDEATPDAWNDQDLAAMLRHQFAAPLGFDLRSLALKAAGTEARETALSQAAASGIESFEDLLFHRQPPLELLKLAKDFFKRRTRECKEGSADWQVAYLFYILSVLAAGTNRSAISALTPGELLKGIGWALQQPWADDKTKCLLSAAAQRLQIGANPGSHAS